MHYDMIKRYWLIKSFKSQIFADAYVCAGIMRHQRSNRKEAACTAYFH